MTEFHMTYPFKHSELDSVFPTASQKKSIFIHFLKNIFVVFLFYILFQFNQVHAHLPGQDPYFKIDGKYSDLYPVLSSSLNDFPLPQDIAKEQYVINKDIEFEIDIEKLPVPKEVVEQTEFRWDFGDGTSGVGLKNTHAYKKMGSYTVYIYAKTTDMPQEQVIQSVMLHVLPNKNYKLPQSIIKVNGKTTKDPLTDTFQVQYDTPVELDASSSKAPSSKVAEYFWDLGDTTTSTIPKLTHSYSQDFPIVFPLLRVKDVNGFISDSYVEIDSLDNPPVQSLQNLQKTPMTFILTIIFVAISVVIVTIVVVLFVRRKR